MKRGVLEPEPEPGVAIRILELPNMFFGAYRTLPNSTQFDLQHVLTGIRNIPISSGVLLPRGTTLLNSTFLCAQGMMHARGLHKPQATSEHDLHTKRFVSACSVRWYLSVPSTMEIATSRGLLWWLAGWLATVLGRSAAS